MKQLLLLITCSILFVFNSDAQTWAWAQKAGAVTTSSGGASIGKDAMGNTYVSGEFQGTATFGSFTLTAGNGVDLFVAKYDPAGTCLWAYKAGGNNTFVYGASMATDPQGNSYITGNFNGTANFSGTSLTSTGFSDLFLAKYNSIGDLQWVFKKGSNGFTEGMGVGLDPFNNVYVTGFFGSTVDFGGASVTAAGGQFDKDIFLAKYDSAGVLKWVKRAGSANEDKGTAVACDAMGNPHLTGSFQGMTAFGTINLTSSGQTDIFVAKYDTAGTAIMAFKSGGNAQDGANGISLDGTGNIYLIGSFYGNAQFGTVGLSGDPNYGDMFIAKYNTAGVCQWAKKGAGNNSDAGLGISTDPGGNSYTTGFFYQSAVFGTTTLTSNGMLDAFVIKYSTSGNVLWAVKAGSAGDDRGKGIIWDANGYCNVVGYFTNTTAFGTTFLTSAGGTYSVFVARMNGGPSSVNSIKEDDKNLEIFPNPATSEVSLNFTGTPGNSYTLEVINTLGEVVYQQDIKDFSGFHNQTLNTSALNKGIYFFRVKGEEIVSSRKVVIL